MKKILTSYLIVFSMLLSPALKAEDVTSDNEGTLVGQAASDGASAAKKRRWQNIGCPTLPPGGSS